MYVEFAWIETIHIITHTIMISSHLVRWMGSINCTMSISVYDNSERVMVKVITHIVIAPSFQFNMQHIFVAIITNAKKHAVNPTSSNWNFVFESNDSISCDFTFKQKFVNCLEITFPRSDLGITT